LPVFERAILRRGVPKRLYVDNGSAYRARHLALVCAKLGVTLIHARPFAPGRNLLGNPLCLRIQPRDAFAGIRILDVPQPVPDQATDVQLVVQDARSTFRAAVDGAWTPGPAERSGDRVLIQPLRNRFRRDSRNVLPEDAVHDGSLPWLDSSFARRDGATGQRFHHAVAVTETAASLAALHTPTQSSMRLLRWRPSLHCHLRSILSLGR
jgi:hypothetical protein